MNTISPTVTLPARKRTCPSCGRYVDTYYLAGNLLWGHHAVKPGGLLVESCPNSHERVLGRA